MAAMLSRRLYACLFALVLLFGQATAFAHALTHLHEHDPALPDKVCEVCVAQAQLGSAVPPSLAALAIPPSDRLLPPCPAPAHTELAPRPACARAPPVPSGI